MVETNNRIDSKLIHNIFGLNSEIFNHSLNFLKSQSKINNSYQEFLLIWKKTFKSIYGHELSSHLFLKHTYFIHILKIIVISKLYSDKSLDFEEIYNKYIKNELKTIFTENYFFWIYFDETLVKKVYLKLRDLKVAKEDLFSKLYQQAFFPDLRHKLGEFFTPSILAKKMVDDVYKIGMRVLDPSCGSGKFIINLIIRIIDANEPLKSRFKAISRIYGFDINPLAVITARTNIFLLLLEYFSEEDLNLVSYNIYLIDSLFPEISKNNSKINIKTLYNSFDLIIGNPPWLTYKDLRSKNYQMKIRKLAEDLGIKPPSQYVTHIELAAIFFYAIPLNFLRVKGKIFFVMPKSVLNGDHCDKFRLFSIFSKNIEIWDFPDSYFFRVNHICLKAEYIGINERILIHEKYPIKTKIFNDKLEFQKETRYTSFKIEDNSVKLILPITELKKLNTAKDSPYKDKFFQGATLVPRSLVFFTITEKKNETLIIQSDLDILSRAKKTWKFKFHNKEIEREFRFKTFLNRELLPFFIKKWKNVFLPINQEFSFDLQLLKKSPKSFKFYSEIEDFYKRNKKQSSSINTLYENLNYWNKLKKQINNKEYIIVYNASGSKLKASIIINEKRRIIIGSENYYYNTDSEEEAYYLSGVLNSPILSKNIQLIKSSRHIHKRPFLFPIPLYNKNDSKHNELARISRKCENDVRDLYFNNPKITSEKIRIILNQRLLKLDELTSQVVFDE